MRVNCAVAGRIRPGSLARVTEPDFLKPFVLAIEPPAVERHGLVDFYLPQAQGPQPAIVFVHGGPLPEQVRPTPRDWPIYQGYGATAAARGVVGVTVDHGPHMMPDPFAKAPAIIADAVEAARADERVDGDRIALWFFSGGGLLMADWLRDPPPWLRCIAASYPLLGPLPGWPDDPRLRIVEAAAGAGSLPIVLTRVGLEKPAITATVEAFIAAAPKGLEVIDVPDGHHGFDYLDHTDQSRDAVAKAFDSVLAKLA
jgi:acetyl esterase/lipase